MLAVRRARALFTQPTRTMSTTQALPKQDDANDKPWYAAFPAPLRSVAEGTLATMSAQELRQRLLDGPKEDDLLVVDVRRTDFETAFIKGAINLPAHSFYQTLPSLVPILSRYRSVIFHCQSSSGRGPRCAGWYQDALDKASLSAETSKAVVLTGGIKEWVKQYGDDEQITIRL
ncbi:hypothetical protein BMF94_1160 [Rhodotorula taiwanensis]|uniref:Rhodanese domain-containing protein n=1 Tax=Rhodotorula taiwanensis TaxID=741276 RepID=A0A2S5BG61_9BASI|nr:hypothetical protein BMF94_1160 [Rhodotorula taiwanensis]